MRVLFDSVIKKRVAILIEVLGIDVNEIVVDLELETDTYQSIEYENLTNKVYLHIFDDTLEISTDFDDLPITDRIEVYNILLSYL